MPELIDRVRRLLELAQSLYVWYVPPFSVERRQLSEEELQRVIDDLEQKGGLRGWLRLDGAYYATDLTTFKKIVDWDWTDTRKYVEETFDCLLPDTPIIYKDPVTGEIDIEEVQNLPQEGGFYVLDMDIESGKLEWTRVNWVRPKYSNKRIVTVASPHGFIQTTEDHKFWVDYEWRQIGEVLREKGEKARLTVAPVEKVFGNHVELDPDLAWVYGLFMAEGTAISFMTRTGMGYNFHIDMCNEDILRKAKEILENHFGVKFEVYLPPSQQKGGKRGGITAKCDLYRLVVRDRYGAGKRAASFFRQTFYTKSGSKKVPRVVLNATHKAKRKFIEGVMIGDATRYKSYAILWQKSRVAVLGIEILLRKLGVLYRYYYYRQKSGRSYPILNVWERSAARGLKYSFYIDADSSNTLVYDLNTESGHFVASTFLVHNCDKFAIYFKARVSLNFGVNAIGVILDYSAGHAYNLVILKEQDGRVQWYLFEPQRDYIFSYNERNREFYTMQEYYLIL